MQLYVVPVWVIPGLERGIATRVALGKDFAENGGRTPGKRRTIVVRSLQNVKLFRCSMGWGSSCNWLGTLNEHSSSMRFVCF
jgi:hypothetical protein